MLLKYNLFRYYFENIEREFIVIMKNLIYLHPHNMKQWSPGELPIVQKIFGKENTTITISNNYPNSIIIPRFRSIPFGFELEQEVKINGCELINSYLEHKNIANFFYWYPLVKDYTAPSYTINDLPKLSDGEYFVKGETNSLKNNWFHSAYASSWKDLVETIHNFQQDNFVGDQEIVIREFQHYRKLIDGVDGRPIFHERRIFALDGKILSEGFYWSSYTEDIGPVEIINEVLYRKIVGEVIDCVKDIARFIVLDFAEFDDGSWQLVELNDGCMSGLSDNNAEVLWKNFYNHFNHE